MAEKAFICPNNLPDSQRTTELLVAELYRFRIRVRPFLLVFVRVINFF